VPRHALWLSARYTAIWLCYPSSQVSACFFSCLNISHLCALFSLISQLPVLHFWFQAHISTLAQPFCLSHLHFIASHFCWSGLPYPSFTFPPTAPSLLLPSPLKRAASERSRFPALRSCGMKKQHTLHFIASSCQRGC
jgi:hypothetical protein